MGYHLNFLDVGYQLSNTKMTESPLRNLNHRVSMTTVCRIQDWGLTHAPYILLINLSLFTALPFFPADVLGTSVHISLTFSKTMLQCLSKAFTLASSLRLLRHEIRT